MTPMTGLRRNILLFHLGALGDFILTWPLALALARIYAQSRIIYVTHPDKGRLAERVLRVESQSIESGWHHLYGDAAQLPEPQRKLLAGAQAIVSFVSSPGDAWSTNATTLSNDAPLTCLRPKPPPDFAAHAIDHLLGQLPPPLEQAARQILAGINDRGLLPSRKPGSSIVIHPGSGSPDKCWPPENYLALAAELRTSGHTVRFVLGETELDRWPPELLARFDAATPKTYVDLLDILSTASAFVGNDSGPGHLAGVIGVPTLSLFGPTDPAVWRPLGPRVAVLRSEPLDRLSVGEAADAVMFLLNPSPA
jgi:heptosyltransferase III